MNENGVKIFNSTREIVSFSRVIYMLRHKDTICFDRIYIYPRENPQSRDLKFDLNSYAASSTTVARKNSVLLSLEMTTTGSRGVSSSSSLLPEAVLVGSSMPGATRAAAPSAVSANLATEYPLRDLSQKPLKKSFYT